ncbi:MAG: Rpn family recombination-promoting nuclease/putative transposase [Oscillospiraceae bacterium]|nr:Rpn family recombination-promoting nuclease/putative transposase [Oscillospiraceae bacterium]
MNDEKNLNNLSKETATKLLSRKFLFPGRNCIFKRLFGDEKNVDIAKSFLSAIPEFDEKRLEDLQIIDVASKI